MSPVDPMQRIQYVTKHYQTLQGLRFIPIGFAMLICALIWMMSPSLLSLSLFGIEIAFLVGFVLYWRIATYYKRAFGWVQPQPAGPISRRVRVVFVAILGIFVMLSIVAPFTPLRGLLFLLRAPHVTALRLIASIAGGIGGVAMLFTYWIMGDLHYRPYWGVIAIVLIIISFALLLPIPALAAFYEPNRWWAVLATVFFLPWSIATIVGGVLDHRLLTRSLGPLPEEKRAGTF